MTELFLCCRNAVQRESGMRALGQGFFERCFCIGTEFGAFELRMNSDARLAIVPRAVTVSFGGAVSAAAFIF
jgi:hypothetical protein